MGGGSRRKEQEAIEVEYVKKGLVGRSCVGSRSKRKQQEAIEVEDVKKVLVGRELRGEAEAEGSSRRLQK